MNKTVTINLANTAFVIDEMAYLLLQEYLNQLKQTFKNTEGSNDILEDIEARIAELFQERKKSNEYVINKVDVEDIIKTLGEPNEFDEGTSEKNNIPPHKVYTDKKLFRDPDDKYIGGVAAGISHYFAFDPTWIRLIWLLLAIFSGGTFFLIYILFWIIVPEAKTTSDKLRMKGKPINIATIEKKIREEFEDVTERVKNVNYEEVGGNLKKKSKNFFDFLVEIIGGIVKIGLKILGLVFLFIAVLGSIGWCIGFTLLFIFKSIEWPIVMHIWGTTPVVGTLVAIAFFILGMIPLVFLFLLGNLLLAPKKNWLGKSIGITLLVLWLLSLIGISIYAYLEHDQYNVTSRVKTIHELQLASQDTLQLHLQNTMGSELIQWEEKGRPYFKDSLGETYMLGEKIRLQLKQSEDSQIEVEIIKKAAGRNYKIAMANAKALQYDFSQQNNNLYFPKEWYLAESQWGFKQDLEIILWLNEEQPFYLSPQIAKHLSWRPKNDQQFNRDEMMGHYWQMNQEVLQCLDCSL